jgi:hypothetical protein
MKPNLTVPVCHMSERRFWVEAETTDLCRCGTNENLVVTGISTVFEIDGKLAWAVTCFDCKARYLIGDEARDVLFGKGWRAPGDEAQP